jgi:23S rRNA (uracil1939-C5)-methyltransferase
MAGELIELELTDIAQGGEAVGRRQGQVVFVRGGLPGEHVRVRLDAASSGRRSFLRGEVAAILQAAPERVAPRLAGAGHMPWQHIDYAAQLRFKQHIVAGQLRRLAGLPAVEVEPVLAAPQPWHYRSTAQLHINGNQAGYFAPGSHDLIDLDADPLLLPVLNEALRELRPLLPPDARGERALTLRASAAYGYAVALLRDMADAEQLAANWQRAVPALAAVQIGEAGHGAEPVTLHEELGGITFSLAAESFFQVNSSQAHRLLELARAGLALPENGRLLDAYSGAGSFALPLAGGLREVLAIEAHPLAVADGERSAALNGIGNVRFIAAPVERALPELAGPFDAVLLDPPRRGCHPAALQALAALRAPRLVYISCHPGILARDLPPLLEAGYQIERIQPIDLFPQTPHIETVVTLAQRG